MRVRLVIRRLHVRHPPGRQHSFVEIDDEIFSSVILSLPLTQEGQLSPSKHVYVGPIWAESGHLSHSSPTWAPYRLFCPYKTHIGPIVVKFWPTNMYIWEPYEQILGIYPIRVQNGPYIGFFANIRPIQVAY